MLSQTQYQTLLAKITEHCAANTFAYAKIALPGQPVSERGLGCGNFAFDEAIVGEQRVALLQQYEEAGSLIAQQLRQHPDVSVEGWRNEKQTFLDQTFGERVVIAYSNGHDLTCRLDVDIVKLRELAGHIASPGDLEGGAPSVPRRG